MASLKTQGWRVVQTVRSDTLAAVALREMGDASRWPEIAWLNDLLPPYITDVADHPTVLAGRAVASGGVLKIPSSGEASGGVTPAESFGTDCRLEQGGLALTPLGDIDVMTGVANLRQALEMRLAAHVGGLMFHPRYGNNAHRIKGQRNTPNAQLLALRYCEECLLGDPRVVAVKDGVAEASGDAILVSVTALVNDVAPLRLQLEI